MDYTLQAYGHDAWLINFKQKQFSKQLCLNILDLADSFRLDAYDWREIVPAYDSLLIKSAYSLTRAGCEAIIKDRLEAFIPLSKITVPQNIIDIPVCYGGAEGPDLDHVARHAGLSTDEVIACHSRAPYLVCLMGFIPGFAFMSETDPRLHIPRRRQPRAYVPSGSVGLAGWQTGIYGLSSPGGWQIIGHTPLTLFDPKRDVPFLFKAGDWVRFVPQGGASC